MYTHSYTFPYGLSENIEYSSLSYAAGPCFLFILYKVVCICQSQTPTPFLSHAFPLGNHKSILSFFSIPLELQNPENTGPNISDFLEFPNGKLPTIFKCFLHEPI